MRDLAAFEVQVAEIFGLVNWSPSKTQLSVLADKFSLLSPDDIDLAYLAMDSVCGSQLRLVMEGVDNSDLRTLLALAIATAKK